jgi:hypothetical protein
MGDESRIRAHPAPWKLTGTGYILLYRFPDQFCRRKGFIPQQNLESFRGGLGTVMYVDYHSSDAGPYQELLFIPGRFDFSGKRFYSITKIYVSTRESVEGGKANWGIPKELASFEKQAEGKGLERIRIHAAGSQIAEFLFQTCRMSIPVTTAVIPSGLRTLAQSQGEGTLLTTLESRGAIAPARLAECSMDSRFFPPINELRPLCTVRVSRFSMVFPQARIMGRLNRNS